MKKDGQLWRWVGYILNVIIWLELKRVIFCLFEPQYAQYVAFLIFFPKQLGCKIFSCQILPSVVFIFYFLSDTCKQMAAAQPSELPTFGRFFWCWLCLLFEEQRCYLFNFGSFRLEPYSVCRKEPFHIGVQLSRKRRKNIAFTQHLKFGAFRGQKN